MSTPVVIASCPPALLRRYTGQVDPVPELRAAVLEAAAWITARAASVEILGGESSLRVAEEILAGRPRGPAGVWVAANGSARRSEKAPGHLDERSFAFDEEVERAIAAGDVAALTSLDLARGDDLLASGLRGLADVAARGGVTNADLRYAADPYGVRYWVATWEIA